MTSMPLIAVGTFHLRGRDTVYKTLDAALACGYRSIDTAACYRNEVDIGCCLKELLPKHGLTREDIFITSKLAPADQGRDRCKVACAKSLNNLDLDYLDMYLIHWPGTAKLKHNDPLNKRNREESWRILEKFYKQGKFKAIGVSNYTVKHMEELLQFSDVKPTLLQVECHPHLVQQDLRKLCQQNNIRFQAYSSLGTASPENKLLTDAVVIEIASKYKRSPSQILLRWAVQQDIGVIPKSENPDHIAENIDIFNFELSVEDMSILASQNQDRHYTWDPTTVL